MVGGGGESGQKGPFPRNVAPGDEIKWLQIST